jgi:uncharacterized protein (TIGR03083 family)
MQPSDFLSHLRAELAAFRGCLDGDLSAPVEHCPGWTIRELAEHLGGQNLWAAVAVAERRGDFRAPAAPRDDAALARWFDGSCTTLLDALEAEPSAEAWTFYPPHTVGFWQRRRCLETLVHRWDAEHALGAGRPLDPELAGEGVAEVFDTMAPRQIQADRARPPRNAIRLHATDTGGTWTYGPGAPVAEITGTAENLLLMLWGRLPDAHEAIAWEGDRGAGLTVLAGPLTA